MPDKKTEAQLQKFVNKEEGVEEKPVGAKITETPAPKFPHTRNNPEVSLGNTVGWQQLPIKDLPTKGLFYPEGTEVAIRSATAGEIRHWSTLVETDPASLDDMLNYVIERCVTFKTKDIHSSWKDIKEVDRFYILLAIRELTFVKGENHLQVKTSETSKINVTKEMIDYITLDPKLMNYYDETKRCFVLKFKSTGKTMEVSIPCIGVTNFLKNYIGRKQDEQQMFDIDFISFAPFVIKDWRGLSDTSYEQMVQESNYWSIPQVSVLTHLKDVFVDAINPVVKFTDEGGAEQVAPLNFLGGIKSVFLISDPFGELV
jgi:hypothetical protein